MKKTILFILIVVALACKNNNQKGETSFEINSAIIKRYTEQDNLIIVTCTRCNCFIESLNSLSEKDKLYLSHYPILTDTVCNALKIPSIFIDSRNIDSISTDIYNITLFKKKGKLFDVRVIQLDESPKILNVIKDFFKP